MHCPGLTVTRERGTEGKSGPLSSSSAVEEWVPSQPRPALPCPAGTTCDAGGSPEQGARPSVWRKIQTEWWAQPEEGTGWWGAPHIWGLEPANSPALLQFPEQWGPCCPSASCVLRLRSPLLPQPTWAQQRPLQGHRESEMSGLAACPSPHNAACGCCGCQG